MNPAMRSPPYIPTIPIKPYCQMYKIINRSTHDLKNLHGPPVHRHVLPEIFIDFSSKYGKALFQEALLSGHMECYFVLAAQFRTQDEPTLCAVSTLVMVLNTLLVDPGVVWKDIWKWYHESMLDCCVPFEVMLQTGVTLEQFVRMAQLNNLDSEPVWVTDDSSLHTFREVIKKYTQRDDAIIVCSYSRVLLGQSGGSRGGHYSTIGGYHEGTDKLLILDVARYKYPSHWVDVPMLFDAMKGVDAVSGLSRGYVLLKRRQSTARHQDTCDHVTESPNSSSECFQYVLQDEPLVFKTHCETESAISGSDSQVDNQSKSEC